jgi:hypothetical protein
VVYEQDSPNMDRSDRQLDSVFRAYRAAVPDPEPSADFMPSLWRRIELKRSFVFRFRRMSQVALGAALAACLLTFMVTAPLTMRDNQLSGSYVDALAEAHADDVLASTGGLRLDLLDNDQH